MDDWLKQKLDNLSKKEFRSGGSYAQPCSEFRFFSTSEDFVSCSPQLSFRGNRGTQNDAVYGVQHGKLSDSGGYLLSRLNIKNKNGYMYRTSL